MVRVLSTSLDEKTSVEMDRDVFTVCHRMRYAVPQAHQSYYLNK